MDGGTRVMKMQAPKMSGDLLPGPMNTMISQPTATPHSPVHDQQGSPRLPNVHLDNGFVSPGYKHGGGGDSLTSPLPSIGARDYRDLRIGLPKIPDSTGSRTSADDKKRKLPTRARSFMPTPRSTSQDDQSKGFNPEPVPFHSQIFHDPLKRVKVIGSSVSASADDATELGASSSSPSRKTKGQKNKRSSTMVKKFPTQSRQTSMWASSESDNVKGTKGYIVHTDRYKWDEVYSTPDEFTQRGRLQIEQEYVDRLRSIRRRREITPHRETLEFMMGGQKAELNERDDVMQELKNLKGILLPTKAKDLYVGRGFSNALPKEHALNKPRGSINLSQLLPFQNALDRARGHAPPNEPQKPKAEAPIERPNTKIVFPHTQSHNPRDAGNNIMTNGVVAVNMLPSHDKASVNEKENHQQQQQQQQRINNTNKTKTLGT